MKLMEKKIVAGYGFAMIMILFRQLMNTRNRFGQQKAMHHISGSTEKVEDNRRVKEFIPGGVLMNELNCWNYS